MCDATGASNVNNPLPVPVLSPIKMVVETPDPAPTVLVPHKSVVCEVHDEQLHVVIPIRINGLKSCCTKLIPEIESDKVVVVGAFGVEIAVVTGLSKLNRLVGLKKLLNTGSVPVPTRDDTVSATPLEIPYPCAV